MAGDTRKYALFSVNEIEGVERFAERISSIGWSIIATEKPYELLKSKGVNVIPLPDFVNIAESYDFPPSLHPKIEHCLTDKAARHRIELVYNIVYNLEEGNDVGGHTLLALAAKGDRLPVSNYHDMEMVSRQLAKGKGVSHGLKQELISKTHFKIAKHFSQLLSRTDQSSFEILLLENKLQLINGENPYQKPCNLMSLSDDKIAIHQLELKSSNLPCFTNIADVDALIHSMTLLTAAFKLNRAELPYITIAAKHGNPCGIGIDWASPGESVLKALWGNPLAVWGGEVLVNFKIDQQIARVLYESEERGESLGSPKWMLDVVVAPHISKEGLRIFEQRKNTKVLTHKGLSAPEQHSGKWCYRYVRGGMLRQPYPSYSLDLKDAQCTGGQLSDVEIDSLIIAWACAFSSNHGGNEVAISRNGILLGAGGGPSTVEAAEIAVMRSRRHNNDLSGASFAADAFFPFEDAPQVLIDAGCTNGLVPSGGIREKYIRKLFTKKKLKVVFLDQMIRGFYRH